MPILSNVEIWFPKVNPTRPNARFNKTNPTWETQVRTYTQAIAEEWENLGMKVTAVIPKEGGAPYWRINLRKKSLKEDGTEAGPVKVVDGKLKPVDPDSIGNGSIANIRIFQYEYTSAQGTKGVASVLMAIQLVKHILYTPKPREDDFDNDIETEVIAEEGVEVDAKSEEKSDPSPSLSPGGKPEEAF